MDTLGEVLQQIFNFSSTDLQFLSHRELVYDAGQRCQ